MKAVRRAVGTILLAAAAVVGIYSGLVLRFANPDMTSTRLLLEFWPFYVATLVLIFGGLLVRGDTR